MQRGDYLYQLCLADVDLYLSRLFLMLFISSLWNLKFLDFFFSCGPFLLMLLSLGDILGLPAL